MWKPFVQVAVIGGLIGFGVYSFTAAFHVWHSRNSKASGAAYRGPGRFLALLNRSFAVILLLSLVGMGFSVAWILMMRHEGIVTGEGLFTVRAPEDLDVVGICSGEVVAKGHVLASFDSAESEAELQKLALELENLRAEEQVLSFQPLILDNEIARKVAEAHAKERALRANLSDLVLVRRQVVRETVRERSVWRDEIQKLQLQIDRLREELKQAESEFRLASEEHERYGSLADKKVVTQQEFSRKRTALDSSRIEVEKLHGQIGQATSNLEQLKADLSELLQVSTDQTDELAADIGAAEKELSEIVLEQAHLRRQQSADRERAAQYRDKQLARVKVRIEQAQQALQAETARRSVKAPFTGRLVYRAASPGNAVPGEPVAVLAPLDGFIFRLRVPRWMRAPLAGTDCVSCELLQDLEKDVQRRFVESRFHSRFVGWEQLSAHPFYGLATMEANVPREAVHQLALGTQVAARLAWHPPMTSMPGFQVSAAGFALSAVAWLLATFLRRRSTVGDAVRADVGELSESPPAFGPATEFGAEGIMLQMLGDRLRAMILSGLPDEDVISAVEWAIDRHRQRAVALVGEVLENEADAVWRSLRIAVQGLSADGNAFAGRDFDARVDLLRRLLSVLRAVAPADLRCRLRDLQEDLSSCRARGSDAALFGVNSS